MRGITCGGYDTDRIFVYHDAKPKLTPYEARPKESVISPSTQSWPEEIHNQLVPSRPVGGNPEFMAPFVLPCLLPTCMAQSAYREKSVETFIRMFSPYGDMRSANIDGKDMVRMLPELTASDEALRLSVVAIGTMELSNQTNNTDLARQGRGIYGKALVETRNALLDPARARSTAILVLA